MPSSGSLDLTRIRKLVIAGWTGRDTAVLERHIRELELLGVPRPKSTPAFYHVAASLLTTGEAIEVLGGHSSGEVECVLHFLDDGVWVGVGSDHTDRKAESIGVALSKQMCAKPISQVIWPLTDVASHWDSLIIRAFAHIDGKRRLYQEGTVASMRPPQDLVRLCAGGNALPPGTSMFCGTLAVLGGITPATMFEMELEDPVLKRTIRHRYRADVLPVEE
jgi:Protein of unknown function (DUF2848)